MAGSYDHITILGTPVFVKCNFASSNVFLFPESIEETTYYSYPL